MNRVFFCLQQRRLGRSIAKAKTGDGIAAQLSADTPALPNSRRSASQGSLTSAQEWARRSDRFADLPMTGGKIDLRAWLPRDFQFARLRRPLAVHRRRARIPEDCRAWTALPANRRQNLRR